jgi:DNA invertase Pin-like site-specific DNA recombinase
MSSVFYCRTSTFCQNGNRFDLSKTQQKYDYCFFDRGVSGMLAFNLRPYGKKIIDMVHQKTVQSVHIPEIRDLGRDVRDTINTLGFFEEMGCNVFIQNLGLQSHVDGKVNPAYTLIVTTLCNVYAMERSNTLWRCKVGLEKYRENGGICGRPVGTKENLKKFLAKEKSIAIASLLNKGKSVRDVAGRLAVSSSTVIKTRRAMVETGVLVVES